MSLRQSLLPFARYNAPCDMRPVQCCAEWAYRRPRITMRIGSADNAKNLRITVRQRTGPDRSVVRTKYFTLRVDNVGYVTWVTWLIGRRALWFGHKWSVGSVSYFVCVRPRAFRTMSLGNYGFQCLLCANKYTYLHHVCLVPGTCARVSSFCRLL